MTALTLAKLPAVGADDGFDRYLRAVRQFPVLKPEEEYMLARRFHDHDDVDAAHALVTSHLRLVAKIAIGYRHYGLPVADLVSEGTLGLMQAVKKFDPERGFRLATYAMWWIKASIHEYILNSWSLVKIGTLSAHKKVFYNLRKIKARLGLLDSRDLSPDEVTLIAGELGVSEADVTTMSRRMAARDGSLNRTVGEDGDLEMMDLLEDERPNQEDMLLDQAETGYRLTLLDGALDALNERERDVFRRRRLTADPETLEDLGREYGVSRERVRQIENRAFDKVRKAVLRHAADDTRRAADARDQGAALA
ncbi:RNA polymerase sigma factor RpoH [Roseospira visakhapatnamensis]|uniref:RNA polymerase sigma factor RpoH n=1 Tax=Roseospira visakhapatnamensis TaxID=390880 RepID=A0A7W6RBD1_9PROT|nr:RNA polymerase sigma factor RpoH [Roseospira visakhapatnamensis]MBB4264733.1 RNA polymerase sigma-32 factor [Roseospira visakhapatnamensis]